ncbi:MAG: hypothetical protein EA385_15165 [Salinarimonadaceae bacterium]|nr:MAG: hypothetical protein EA385_15165 [Salinarimonadaceae bacterium]
MVNNGEMNVWQPMAAAPKDGTWILLRGRNDVGHPMIPVVVAWCPPGIGSRGVGWFDTASFRLMDSLAATPGADWASLPS